MVRAPAGMAIWSVATALPPTCRDNNSWAPEIVERWRKLGGLVSARATLQRGLVAAQDRPIMEAIAAYEDDPFAGARTRRVLAVGESTLDLEQQAATRALERAGVGTGEVDALLSFSHRPDELTNNPAAALHRRLGLKPSCLSCSIDAAHNSFLQQLLLAEGLVAAGVARCVLLTQSAGALHLIPPSLHDSVSYGDGASAVVVGPPAGGSGNGLLGRAVKVDGALARGLVIGGVGKPWWVADARREYHAADPRLSRPMLFTAVRWAPELCQRALEDADLQAPQVALYASTQPTPWFLSLTRQMCGLESAHSHELFAELGNLAASMVPAQLEAALEAKTLKEGSVALLYSTGAGFTGAAVVIRWGR